MMHNPPCGGRARRIGSRSGRLRSGLRRDFIIPGPQLRGTGATLNLIDFLRSGPPANHILVAYSAQDI